MDGRRVLTHAHTLTRDPRITPPPARRRPAPPHLEMSLAPAPHPQHQPTHPGWAPTEAGVRHIAMLLAEVHTPGANQGQVKGLGEWEKESMWAAGGRERD